MIFALRLYSKEVRCAIYACFIDLRKAYDSIDRGTLWKVLQWYGIDGNLLDMIELLYLDMKACIRVGESRTEGGLQPHGRGEARMCCCPLYLVYHLPRLRGQTGNRPIR